MHPLRSIPRHIAHATCLAALTLAFAGCSKSPSRPGASTPPGGTGTNTLLVTADVAGSDVAPGVFSTDLTVSVSDTTGAPVSGATVQFMTPTGAVALPEDGATPGTYRTSRSGYAMGTYTLDVTRGADRVSGAWVVAPDVHTITAPAPNDTIPATSPLGVSWNRVSIAQEALIESRDYQSAAEPDDGTSQVPPSGNPARADQRIRVFRLNRTLITGGRPGSELEATIRNSVDPVVAI